MTNFEMLKVEFECAYAADAHSIRTGEAAMNLAAAAAKSVVRKLIDPARASAPARESVSNSGCNPMMDRLRRDIASDFAALVNLYAASAASRRIRANKDGEAVSDIVDKGAEAVADALIRECLNDGIDLVQEAALALLEQAAEHANAHGWLDAPYTRRKLSKRVYVSTAAAPEYREEETTPMREVYRAVRRAVASSRAVQTDPRYGYTYAEDITEDGLDTILYRSGRYADVGGYDCNGNYTGDVSTLRDMDALVARMGLTDRQARVLELRMRGYSLEAVAAHVGTSKGAIARAVTGLREAAIAAGIAAAEMGADNAPTAARAVEQLDVSGAVLAAYPSTRAAEAVTGINNGSISRCAAGQRSTAGGYRWRFVR